MSGTLTTKERSSSLRSFLMSDGVVNAIKLALPKHITPEKIIRVALTAAVKNPTLLECSPESVYLSILNLAQIGLIPDGRMAALVPFAREAKAMPMYQGLVHLAYQSDRVASCTGCAVREKDYFEWERGTTEYLRYKPSEEPDAGPLTHAWAMVTMSNGGKPFVVLNRREVMAAKACSKTSRRSDSPWNNPETEPAMWAKTAFLRLSKWIPQSPDLIRAMELNDEAESYGDDRRGPQSVDALTSVISPNIQHDESHGEPIEEVNQEIPDFETDLATSLSKCDTKTAVGDVRFKFRDQAGTDGERLAMVNERCEAREAEIHASRGSRSNAKQTGTP